MRLGSRRSLPSALVQLEHASSSGEKQLESKFSCLIWWASTDSFKAASECKVMRMNLSFTPGDPQHTCKPNHYSEGGCCKYGFINYFLSLQSSSFSIITPLTPTLSFCYPNHLSVLRHFIIPVKLELSVLVIQTKCILYKCVCVQFNRVCFVANLPNHLYGD